MIPPEIHIFYYPWFGNPATDGKFRKWNHEIMNTDTDFCYPGGTDIGADFYPRDGCYSCNDEKNILRQFTEIKNCGISVIVVSWWGIGSFEDKTLPLLFDMAAASGLKIAFHLEPRPDNSAILIHNDLTYLLDKFSAHPALYRFQQKPFVYAYDSYLVSPAEWKKLLLPKQKYSIRNCKNDCFFAGLLLDPEDVNLHAECGFDGLYSYFAADGFTWGCTSDNWETAFKLCKSRNLLFIPCPGAGYSDQRIRPFNTKNYRNRAKGQYYKKAFAAAVKLNSAIIAITSYNEWHEGTQIEPAIPFRTADFVYRDYFPEEPDFYLKLTRQMINSLSEKK